MVKNIYILFVLIIIAAAIAGWYLYSAQGKMICGPCGCDNSECGGSPRPPRSSIISTSFEDGFENTTNFVYISDIKITEENKWYKESPTSIASIASYPVHTGNKAAKLEASNWTYSSIALGIKNSNFVLSYPKITWRAWFLIPVDSKNKGVGFSLQPELFNGTYNFFPQIGIDSTGLLGYVDENCQYKTLQTGVYLNDSWHVAKITVNFNTKKYVSFDLDERHWELNYNMCKRALKTEIPFLGFYANINAGSSNVNLLVDDTRYDLMSQ